MARAKFDRGSQRKFLDDVMKRTGLKLGQAARLCNVCSRTFRDWRREKYRISYNALSKLCEASKLSVPKDIEILPDYWSVKKAAHLGGIRYVELHGNPGTLEGRRRGGTTTQNKFKKDPTYAKKIGFILRKNIKCPDKSPLLAEFIGMMIGDGGIRNNYQITISFNGEKDRDYAIYIQRMVKNLFGISSTEYIRKQKGAADIVVTSRNLVEFLEKTGIKKGNKVLNQINIPNWVFECEEYQSASLRGLFDTDGCVYQHNYTVRGKKYSYAKMCFRNYSLPVLLSLKKILENLGFHPTIDRRQKSVYLHSFSEVNKYFLEIGTSNPRYYNRYNKFLSKK